MLRYNVLCVGSATVDHFLTIDKKISEIKPGDKVLASKIEVHSGGGGTNSAAALAKLGLKVKVLTKVGDDHSAGIVINELKAYKIKNIAKFSSRQDTDVSVILSSTKEKDRIIFVHKGASRDLSEHDFTKSELNASWIYLATLVGKSFHTGKKIALYAKKKNINLLFNPSFYLAQKGKQKLKSILKATTLLVLNKEEAQELLQTKEISGKKLSLALQRLGIKTVVITNGDKRLYAVNRDSVNVNTIYTLQPPKIKVIHTAGAGDAFTGGLLAGIIQGYGLAKALRLGQVNALSVIQHLGAKMGLLAKKEAWRKMRSYKIRITEEKL